MTSTNEPEETWHFSTFLNSGEYCRIGTITDPSDREQVGKVYQRINSLRDDGEIDVPDTLLLYQKVHELTGITPGTALGTAIPLEQIK